MKSIYLLAGLLLIIPLSGAAQDLVSQKNYETNDQAVISGFFSFDNKLSIINGDYGWFSGGTFGMVINKQTRIGMGGYSLVNNNPFDYWNFEGDHRLNKLSSEIGYFGLAFEHIFLPDAPVHVTIPILLSGGEVEIKQKVQTFADPQKTGTSYWAIVEKSKIAVIEPGINIELEILPWMNLDLGTSYRFVLGSELNSLPNSDRNLSGASFHTGLKFNCF
jgi:hypothetical protein